MGTTDEKRGTRDDKMGHGAINRDNWQWRGTSDDKVGQGAIKIGTSVDKGDK